ncbi:MAG: DNA polymerase III subunit delta [Minisyncoccota bacterium]
MLYFLYGTDIIESRKKLQVLLASLAKKRPDAEVFRLKEDNWNEGSFQELLNAQGLFDQKYIAVLDGLSEYKESSEILLENIKMMQESTHVFLLIENNPSKKIVDTISKHAEKTQEFAKVEKKKEFFNTFSLGDALGNKDKKSLWVGYLEALKQDISAEEICGVLFWQVKNIIIVQQTKNASESKLSPFVDSKARCYAKNFTKEELLKLSSALVDTTEKVRNGEGEMEVLLERVLLKI